MRDLGGRRDRAFRALVTGVLVVPRRPEPMGAAARNRHRAANDAAALGRHGPAADPHAPRRVPRPPLSRRCWRSRDMDSSSPARSGSATGPARSSSPSARRRSLVGVAIAILVDFAKVRAPYAGALPHVIFVLCMALFLAREYSARGARVAATERQFEAAFEHAPIGKALLALDGRFLRVNRALCRILGCDRRGALRATAPATSRTTTTEGPTRWSSGDCSRARSQPTPSRNVLLRKDGEPAWALLAVSVVPDDHGRPAPRSSLRCRT